MITCPEASEIGYLEPSVTERLSILSEDSAESDKFLVCYRPVLLHGVRAVVVLIEIPWARCDER